jgi:hypothetical protein
VRKETAKWAQVIKSAGIKPPIVLPRNFDSDIM